VVKGGKGRGRGVFGGPSGMKPVGPVEPWSQGLSGGLSAGLAAAPGLFRPWLVLQGSSGATISIRLPALRGAPLGSRARVEGRSGRCRACVDHAPTSLAGVLVGDRSGSPCCKAFRPHQSSAPRSRCVGSKGQGVATSCPSSGRSPSTPCHSRRGLVGGCGSAGLPCT